MNPNKSMFMIRLIDRLNNYSIRIIGFLSNNFINLIELILRLIFVH